MISSSTHALFLVLCFHYVVYDTSSAIFLLYVILIVLVRQAEPQMLKHSAYNPPNRANLLRSSWCEDTCLLLS